MIARLLLLVRQPLLVTDIENEIEVEGTRSGVRHVGPMPSTTKNEVSGNPKAASSLHFAIPKTSVMSNIEILHFRWRFPLSQFWFIFTTTVQSSRWCIQERKLMAKPKPKAEKPRRLMGHDTVYSRTATWQKRQTCISCHPSLGFL